MSKLPHPARWALLAEAGSLACAGALPIWSIRLRAPQYPEGLGMFIHARRIVGDTPNSLENINILNHYIGMRAIDPGAIPELRVIPWVIGALAALALLNALRPTLAGLAAGLAALAGAGAAGLWDFWRWEYDFGHNLNPLAPIQIPGMSYQPPLLGTKQLLNITSTSLPELGGYLLLLAGAIQALALWLALPPALKARLPALLRLARGRRAPVAAGRARPGLRAVAWVAAALALPSLWGCGGPEPLDYGHDLCAHCRMLIAQAGFGAERVGAKGKVRKFDSIECLLEDLAADPAGPGERIYVSDLAGGGTLVPAQQASYLRGGALRSPMGGSLGAFASADSAAAFRARYAGDAIAWDALGPRR